MTYILGLSHAVTALCALYLLFPPPKALQLVPTPYMVVYEPDCYIDAPDGSGSRLVSLSLADLERLKP